MSSFARQNEQKPDGHDLNATHADGEVVRIESDTDPQLESDTGKFIFPPYTSTKELIASFNSYFENRSYIECFTAINRLKYLYFEKLQKSAQIDCQHAGAYYASSQKNSFTYFRNEFIPADNSVIAITDLEGNFNYLKNILTESRFVERLVQGEKVTLCILGDSIDRGTESLKVIEFFAWLKNMPFFRDRVVILAGNHEVMPGCHASEGTFGFLYSCILDQSMINQDQCQVSADFLKQAKSFSHFNQESNSYYVDLVVKEFASYTFSGLDSRFRCSNWSAWREVKHKFTEKYAQNIENTADAQLQAQVAGRFLLYQECLDLFDLLPLTVNHGNRVLLGHTAITNQRYLKQIASSFKFSEMEQANWLSLSLPWASSNGQVSMDRNRQGRFFYGNSYAFSVAQVFRDLLFADICSGNGLHVNHGRGGVEKHIKNYAYGENLVNEFLDELGVKFSVSGHQDVPLAVSEITSEVSHDLARYSLDRRNLYNIGRATKFASNVRNKYGTSLELRADSLDLSGEFSLDSLLVSGGIRAYADE